MKINFTNKRYLITGASSGLGRELCYSLNDEGASLTILGKNNMELSKTFNKLGKKRGHRKIVADFSNLKKSKNIINNIFRNYKYDGFINCAGIHTFSSINNIKDKDIVDSYNINSIYPYIIVKYFSKTSNHNKNSSIILMGTISSITGSSYLSLYSSSKATQINLAMSLATEFAKKKIRINSISASMLQSKIYDKIKTEIPEKFLAEINKKHPLGIGTYIEIINSIKFLLSENSRWITGTNLIVDGGYSSS